VLLTRAPLEDPGIATEVSPYDLHVLNTPPAFVLSQNQTLRKNMNRLADVVSDIFTKLTLPNPVSKTGPAPARSSIPKLEPKARSTQFSLFLPLSSGLLPNWHPAC
jgi:hypothetical protein